jgi:16S rRNA processing protein RimM
MTVQPDEWVRIGVVARAHGIKGVLRFKLDDPRSTTLHSGLDVRVGNRSFRVTAFVASLLTLEGVVDRTAAESLQGSVLSVRRSDFPSQASYLIDLIGAPVTDTQGATLGVVVGFSDNGAQPLIEVARDRTRPQETVSVPFVSAFVVSAAPSGFVLKPPPGLFDDDAVVDGSDADPTE